MFQEPFQQFMFLANYLPYPRMLACPSDAPKKAAVNWDDYLTNGNFRLSYFAGICASESAPRTMLMGDRNIEGLGPYSGCANAGGMYGRELSTNSYWSDEVHKNGGNIAFPDGSAEKLGDSTLRTLAASQACSAQCQGKHILVPCADCGLGLP